MSAHIEDAQVARALARRSRIARRHDVPCFGMTSSGDDIAVGPVCLRLRGRGSRGRRGRGRGATRGSSRAAATRHGDLAAPCVIVAIYESSRTRWRRPLTHGHSRGRLEVLGSRRVAAGLPSALGAWLSCSDCDRSECGLRLFGVCVMQPYAFFDDPACVEARRQNLGFVDVVSELARRGSSGSRKPQCEHMSVLFFPV